MNAVISIVVPVYKTPEKYLRQCIESCLSQTYKEIEIILVNDGSPDNCKDICDEYAKDDERIRVINKKNGGLSSARNAGVKAATGGWLFFLDADDWIEKDTCECLYDCAVKYDVDMVIGGMLKDYGHTSTKYKVNLIDSKIYEGRECLDLRKKLLMYEENIATAWGKLVSLDLIRSNNIYHDENLKQGAEGLEYNYRLFEKCGRITYLDKPFYHYVYNSESITGDFNEANTQLVIKCFEKLETEIMPDKDSGELLPWMYNKLVYAITAVTISGYFNPDVEIANRKEKFGTFLEKPIVGRALKNAKERPLSFQRKVVVALIKGRCCFMLSILGKIRRWQKKRR